MIGLCPLNLAKVIQYVTCEVCCHDLSQHGMNTVGEWPCGACEPMYDSCTSCKCENFVPQVERMDMGLSTKASVGVLIVGNVSEEAATI